MMPAPAAPSTAPPPALVLRLPCLRVRRRRGQNSLLVTRRNICFDDFVGAADDGFFDRGHVFGFRCRFFRNSHWLRFCLVHCDVRFGGGFGLACGPASGLFDAPPPWSTSTTWPGSLCALFAEADGVDLGPFPMAEPLSCASTIPQFAGHRQLTIV